MIFRLGTQNYLLSEQSLDFFTPKLKEYVLLHEVISSKTTHYHTQGNAHIES